MTPSQKLRSIADSTGLDGIADAIREIANEIEHNNAPAVPMSESQRADMICAVAAICTGTSSRTVAATAIEWVERYYGITTPAAPSQPAVPQGYPVLPDYVEDAIERCKNMPGHPPAWVDMMRSMRKALGAATPAPAPARGEPFGYFRAEPFGWTDCSEDAEGAIALYEHPAKPAQEVGLTDEVPAHVAGLLEHRRELDAIEFFESTNRDSYEFKKSVRGIYVNPAVARDWKWFQLGMKHATEDES